MNRKKIITIFIGLTMLALDLVSKYFFYNMDIGASSAMIDKACNGGISFSIPVDLTLIIIISITFLAILFYLFRTKKISDSIFALLFAGAIGNLYDRVTMGCVRDFIVMPRMFVFNIADIFISLAFIFIIYENFLTDTSQKKLKYKIFFIHELFQPLTCKNMKNTNILQIKWLKKTFKTGFRKNQKLEILKGLDLELEAGEVYGLIGPNGVGKTTLINCIMGFDEINGGEINIFGSHLNQQVLSKIGYASDSTSYYEHLTGRETLLSFARLQNQDTKYINTKANELFTKLGLDFAKDRLVKTYSTGMKKRLGIMISLINDPDFLIWDEPMNGLDPLGRALVRDIVFELKSRQKTMIFCTHILDDVEKICDKFGILRNGKIFYTKKISDLDEDLESIFESKLKDKVDNVL